MITQAPFEPFQASNQLAVIEPVYIRHNDLSILTAILLIVGVILVIKLIKDK